MPACSHDVRPGEWCVTCGRKIKPSKLDKELNHYMNAPQAHRDTCPRCIKVGDMASRLLKDMRTDADAEYARDIRKEINNRATP